MNRCFSCSINISNISTTLALIPKKINIKHTNAYTYYEKYDK